MYLGRIVELAPRRELYQDPRHPYTEALLSAIPKTHPSNSAQRIVLNGDVPNPANPPTGCHFQSALPLRARYLSHGSAAAARGAPRSRRGMSFR